jgi:hypothetical protein
LPVGQRRLSSSNQFWTEPFGDNYSLRVLLWEVHAAEEGLRARGRVLISEMFSSPRRWLLA